MRTRLKVVLPLLAVIAVMTACDKIKPEAVDGTIVDGLWYVDVYSVNNYHDEDIFKGYKFDFKENKTASSTNGVTTVEGVWSTEKGSGQQRSQSYLNLQLPYVGHFDKLCARWHVMALSAMRIEMAYQDGKDYVRLVFRHF